MYDITHAIQSLYPMVSWSISSEDYTTLVWNSTSIPMPTLVELEDEIARLDIEHNKTNYQRLRAEEYPMLATFADAYYWAQKNDNTKMSAWLESCDIVKNKYPKPE
jgi:hypothetical protein